jgi:hypothetical protein
MLSGMLVRKSDDINSRLLHGCRNSGLVSGAIRGLSA